jgi:uncharacterized protein DUF5666
MKLKALILALFVAGLASSFALASPPPGKGPKGSTSTSTSTSTDGTTQAATPACKPVVSFILKGSVESVAADSFTMKAEKGNSHFRKLELPNPVTVKVDAKTKFNGHRKLADLKAQDRVNVQVRGCKKADAATFVLLAKRVSVHGAKDASDDDDDAPATTTATATTTSA